MIEALVLLSSMLLAITTYKVGYVEGERKMVELILVKYLTDKSHTQNEGMDESMQEDLD